MTAMEKLIREIEIEFTYLDETCLEVQDLLIDLLSREPNKIELAASSQFVSQFYNGIENILKRISKFNMLPLNSTGNWHIDLLNLYYDKSDKVRISLFNDENYEILNSYRKIRHVIRQGYNFQLDWDKLSIALENMITFLSVFKSIIYKYLKSVKT